MAFLISGIAQNPCPNAEKIKNTPAVLINQIDLFFSTPAPSSL